MNRKTFCIIFIFSLMLCSCAKKEQTVDTCDSVTVSEETQEHQTEYERQEAIGEKLVLNIQDYYSTNVGDFGNLYYIDELGVLWGCGKNQYGQLGQGTHDDNFHPQMVQIAEDVIHVDYAWNYTIFLTEDHKLYGMGCANTGAMLEFEEYSSEIFLNPALYIVDSPKLLMEGVIYARRGQGDIVCLLEDGSVWTWGLIWYEGFNDWYFAAKPEKILDGAVLITGGWYNHAALLTDGSVWTWGYNYAGNCGYDGDVVISTPVKVAEDAVMVWTEKTEYNVDCIDISIIGECKQSLENTIILKKDGTYWACGANIGSEEKILPRYWEANDCNMVCTSEFMQIADQNDI